MSNEAAVFPNGRPLAPLPADLFLPPLPPITDKELRATASTHTSVYSIRREGREIAMNSKILDYEKLEHVGDGLLGSCVVVLLHELYPKLRQGPASRLKDDLVSNNMLSQLADRYGISDQLKASQSAFYVTKLQVKTRGSLFESWIAGVFYSYLKDGPPQVDSQDEPNLIGPTPEGSSSPYHSPQQAKPAPISEASTALSTAQHVKSNDSTEKTSQDGPASSSDDDSSSESDSEESLELPPIHQYPTMTADRPESSVLIRQVAKNMSSDVEQAENKPAAIKITSAVEDPVTADGSSSKPRTYGEAFDYLYAWLKPLLTPIAQYALQHRLAEQARLNTACAVEQQDEEDQSAGGAKLALDLYAKNTWGVDPVYTAVRPEVVKGIWKASATVTQPNGEVWKGAAARSTKRLGYNLAAYQILKQLGVL